MCVSLIVPPSPSPEDENPTSKWTGLVPEICWKSGSTKGMHVKQRNVHLIELI